MKLAEIRYENWGVIMTHDNFLVNLGTSSYDLQVQGCEDLPEKKRVKIPEKDVEDVEDELLSNDRGQSWHTIDRLLA
jgi:hypothetical protein